MQNLDWYNTLIKPALNPPAWVFMPVWTVLYAMIFLSFVLFLKTGNLDEKLFPLAFFLVQMALNFAWSPVFFGQHNIKLAFLMIVVMWVFILLTILTFYPHSKPAAFLLLPYFLWVSFASYLNFELLRLNHAA